MIRSIFFITLVLFLTGCASISNGDTQTISVRALCGDQVLPATCVAENSKGRWTFVAPRQLTVAKDYYALRVDCKSIYLDRHVVQVPASLEPAMAGNLLVGGLVGAAVDIRTRRGMSYPQHIDVKYPSCNFQ